MRKFDKAEAHYDEGCTGKQEVDAVQVGQLVASVDMC